MFDSPFVGTGEVAQGRTRMRANRNDGLAKRMSPRYLIAAAAAVTMLVVGHMPARATTYYSAYGQSRTWNVNPTSVGQYSFEVDGIAQNKWTEWYVNGVYAGSAENDYSGFFAIDPNYTYTFSSGATQIKALVYNNDFTVLHETHTWNVTVQTVISAYWLPPLFVTEGAVAIMRAEVGGFAIGDQFSLEIREDDSPFGSDPVTTKTGNVYSSGGRYYVDASWTTVWQSDQIGDPEFYFIVSRGNVYVNPAEQMLMNCMWPMALFWPAALRACPGQ